MPLPLAMMIPFMGIQSMVMAKQFGENFQYGKRRISAMSNDDFNKLTPAKLLSNANDELKSQIPLMQQSMEDMRQFQTFIVKEFLLTIRSIIDAGLGKLIGLTPTEINQTVQNIEHFLHGHFEGHGGTTDPADGTTPPPPSQETPIEKISLTQAEVLNMSVTQIAQALDNDFANYTSASLQLLTSEKERRIRNGTWPKPDEFEDFVPPDLKLIDYTWLNINAEGKIKARASPDGRWEVFSNPQRNGNWRTKNRLFTGKDVAINWMHNNGFPSSTYATHGARPQINQNRQYFFTKKSKIKTYQES